MAEVHSLEGIGRYCLNCGYLLEGNISGTCPECGYRLLSSLPYRVRTRSFLTSGLRFVSTAIAPRALRCTFWWRISEAISLRDYVRILTANFSLGIMLILIVGGFVNRVYVEESFVVGVSYTDDDAGEPFSSTTVTQRSYFWYSRIEPFSLDLSNYDSSRPRRTNLTTVGRRLKLGGSNAMDNSLMGVLVCTVILSWLMPCLALRCASVRERTLCRRDRLAIKVATGSMSFMLPVTSLAVLVVFIVERLCRVWAPAVTPLSPSIRLLVLVGLPILLSGAIWRYALSFDRTGTLLKICLSKNVFVAVFGVVAPLSPVIWFVQTHG